MMPPRSAIGQFLVVCYTAPVKEIIVVHCFSSIMYADDTQYHNITNKKWSNDHKSWTLSPEMNTCPQRSSLGIAKAVPGPLQFDHHRLQSSPWHLSKLHFRSSYNLQPTESSTVIFKTPSQHLSWSNKGLWWQINGFSNQLTDRWYVFLQLLPQSMKLLTHYGKEMPHSHIFLPVSSNTSFLISYDIHLCFNQCMYV